jgi:hypothetical protein
LHCKTTCPKYDNQILGNKIVILNLEVRIIVIDKNYKMRFIIVIDHYIRTLEVTKYITITKCNIIVHQDFNDA